MMSKLLGNHFSPSPVLPSAPLSDLVRNRTWGHCGSFRELLYAYTHIHKIKYVQYLSFNIYHLNVSLWSSLHLKTQLLPYSRDIWYQMGFLKEAAEETLTLPKQHRHSTKKKNQRLNQKQLELTVTSVVQLHKCAAKETGLPELGLSSCNADPVETCVPQLLMNECKRLDSQNIIKVWWRSNLRLPSLICQERSQQEILKSSIHLMLKRVVQLLLCRGTFLVSLQTWNNKSLYKTTQLQPFNDQPLYPKEGQKNHCSVINMHATWQNTPWQLPHCLWGRYQLSHLLNWLQNRHLQRLL